MTTTSSIRSTTTPEPVDTDWGPIARRTGWVLTALATLFLGFDSLTHLLRVDQVVAANAEMGGDEQFVVVCGAVLAVCIVGYLVPRTRAMATVLITAYLGGAIAVNLLTERPASTIVFALATAVVVWAGAWPRDHRLRALLAA